MKSITAPNGGDKRSRRGLQHLGFTLIELLITVVIISILAAIAYPSYTRYVIETRRADGQSGILQLSSKLEKYFTQCNQYTNVIVGGAIDKCTGLGYLDNLSPDKNYTLEIVAGPSGDWVTSYKINAAPQLAQANDSECKVLWMQSDGVKSQTGPDTRKRCWRK